MDGRDYKQWTRTRWPKQQWGKLRTTRPMALLSRWLTMEEVDDPGSVVSGCSRAVRVDDCPGHRQSDPVPWEAQGGTRIFAIQPVHNPVGPFDLDGGFDERSARRPNLSELINRGYEDAYHQFVEPVVGASGDRVGLGRG